MTKTSTTGLPARILKVPSAPTLLSAGDGAHARIDDLFSGPLDTAVAATVVTPAERLRQAYFWMVNSAIISTHYDISFNDTPPARFLFGDARMEVELPTAPSYSSFVLLPLLTLAVQGRCLLIGGPGRGKTSTATLIGVLAGHSAEEVHANLVQGHPQLTVADLIGTPLPADLATAQSLSEIRIGWRKWLSMRVRIVDEYNRIPTRTQSALLTVLADNYASMYDQQLHCPPGAWFLTANDDAGGGTYPVIEALRDRVDVVVQALSFNHRFLPDLLDRIERGYRPEQVVPEQLIFTPEELTTLKQEILAVGVAPDIMRRLEFFFASHFEYLEQAGKILEYQTKDTARTSGIDVSRVSSADTGRDRRSDAGTQTLNGLSVRALQAILLYAKALAYFRGRTDADLDDMRAIVPFVLRDRLSPDHQSPFFADANNEAYRSDRVGWIRNLFDQACNRYEQLRLDIDDPVRDLLEEAAEGLTGLDEQEVDTRIDSIESLLEQWSRERKVDGPVYEDILALKSLHQKYTSYRAWLRWAR